jgi:hypothetical protein
MWGFVYNRRKFWICVAYYYLFFKLPPPRVVSSRTEILIAKEVANCM